MDFLAYGPSQTPERGGQIWRVTAKSIAAESYPSLSPTPPPKKILYDGICRWAVKIMGLALGAAPATTSVR